MKQPDRIQKLEQRVRELEKHGKTLVAHNTKHFNVARDATAKYNALTKSAEADRLALKALSDAVQEADKAEWFDDWEDLAEKREDCYVQGWQDCVQQIIEGERGRRLMTEQTESGDD